MKNLFLFLLAVVVLSGCSKDDDKGDVVENTKVLFLKKIESEDAIVTYQYNGNKISEIASEIYDLDEIITGKGVYTYEGDLIVKQESFSKEGSSTFKQEYFYENNKLKIYYFVDGEYIRKTTYVHKNDGTVSFNLYKVDSKTMTETYLDSGVYTFLKGNLVKYENSKVITVYEHDDKKNHSKNILGLNKLIGETANQNNVLKETITHKDSGISSISSYEYDYNSDGYPIVQRYFYNGKPYGTTKYSY